MSKPNPFNKSFFQFIYQYIKPNKSYFFIGLVSLFLSGFTTMFFPFVAGKLIDVAIGKSNAYFSNLGQVVILMFIILGLQSIFSFFRVMFFSIVSEKAIANLRSSLFKKMVHLPIHFFETNRVGDLMSRLSGDVSLFQDLLSTSMAELLRQIITLVIGVVILFYTSVKLTLFMLATFPVIVVLAIVFGKKIKENSKITQNKTAEANTLAEEIFQSIHITKGYVKESFESDKYSNNINEVANFALKVAKWRALFISFIIFGIFGGIVLVLWTGAELVKEQAISIGDLTSFILYTGFIGASVAGMGDLFSQIQKVKGASERIREILLLDDETENKSILPLVFNHSISFKNIQFAYPSRKELLIFKDFNLNIPKGKSIALVGASGAGKSTILQLLLRFYEGYEGGIEIDDKNIKDIPLLTYRNLFAVVPQDITLFGGSIFENIAYSNSKARKEDVINAAKLAYAHDFIDSFPDKYDTLVGERGIKLSGGQRQRIAIARAILKNPEILILDEATSALDNESEKIVQQALENVMKSRTTLIVAHRLSTIQAADKIIVLDEGKIVQEGTHQELIRDEKGHYANFCKQLEYLQTN